VTSPPRLRRGLSLLITAFGIALALTYAWVVPRLVLDTEDNVFSHQLERLRAQAAQREGAEGTLDAPGARVVRDLSREPPELAAFLHSLAPGVHEFNDDPLPGLSTTELIVEAVPGPDGAPAWWLLYDLTGLEALEGPWSLRYLGAIGGGVALAMAATIVGLLASRRLFAALVDLEQLVGSEATATQGSAAEQRDDEIGRIARLWRRTDTRLRSMIAREQRFTRDASHELRTPIAAARGALELLRAEPQADTRRREELHRRIDSALVEMNELVQAFLWLAREPDHARSGMDDEEFDLGALVERLVAERVALAGPSVKIKLERRSNASITGSERLARVIVGNMLGNAVAHGDGSVQVELDGSRLMIANHSMQPAHETPVEGFGFGLQIASELCARFGWRLESGLDGSMFVVRIDFETRVRAVSP
jgi:signal transduction histidine kinase